MHGTADDIHLFKKEYKIIFCLKPFFNSLKSAISGYPFDYEQYLLHNQYHETFWQYKNRKFLFIHNKWPVMM